MSNVVEFWRMASEYEMEGLMKQVAQFLSKEPVDKQWPVDLIVRILSLNREEIEELKTKRKLGEDAEHLRWENKFRRIHKSAIEAPWFCKHSGQPRYKPVNDCQDCSQQLNDSEDSADEDQTQE